MGSIACAPGGRCYLTAYMTKYSGEIVYASANDGRTWTVDTFVTDEPDAMTCLNSSSCLAVGEIPPNGMGLAFPAASDATRDGWASSAARHPAHWRWLTSVACMSSSFCLAAGMHATGNAKEVLITRNFGNSWTAVPDDGLLPWAVSCPDATTCVVGGAPLNGSQYVAETVNGGRSWTKTTISKFPASAGMNTYSLDCPSPGHCVAIEYGSGPTVIVVS